MYHPRDEQEHESKKELCHEIISICNANKDNIYCTSYQIKDMIDRAFRLWMV